MGVKKLLKPLDDVFDESLDQVIAPSLGKIYGYMKGLEKPESKLDEYIYDLYGKSRKFFSITYITSGMEKVFNEVIKALENGSTGPIILPSLFGGGKTHLLLALLHAFQDPEAILFAEPKDTAEKLYENLKNLLQSKKIDKIDIVVIDGDYEKYAPSPIKPLNVGPYTVYTIWGYIAHSLGRYDIVRDYDEKQAAPSKDALEDLFRDKHALILMDEVLSGYAVNLDNTQRGKLREFFKRLASALQGKNIATVITIPAYYREQTGRIETEELYKDIADFIEGFFDAVREQGVIVPPVRYAEEYGGSDVVKILRKRIFGKAEISVPADKISDLISHYQGVYSLGMFPSTAGQIELLKEYYPFHPTYIDILIRHIAERRPTTFQRTRFAILITRKVIRNLWQSNRDPDFIHAWSIDLENGDISAAILGKLSKRKAIKIMLINYMRLQRSLSNEEENLAKDIITTIFLRTFLYEGASERNKGLSHRE